MIERDYIMRMISVLAATMARVLLLKQQKDFPGALLELEATSRTLLGVDRDLISRFSTDQLMEMFGLDDSVAVPKSYVLGVLLKEEAGIRRMMGEPDQAGLLSLRSLALLLDTLRRGEKPVESRHPILIDELLGELRAYVLPADLLEKAFRYQENMGRFDRAEDLLFELLESKPGYREEGLRFYDRLLARTDAELEAGNLPRTEIVEAIAELKGRQDPG